MEKTIQIDGDPIAFKSTGLTLRLYKSQFNRDFFQDILKLVPVMKKMEGVEDITIDNADVLSDIDFDIFRRMVWVLAKTADRSTPDLDSWLDGFDYDPTLEILPDLMDLMLHSLGNMSKKKTIPATKSKGQRNR